MFGDTADEIKRNVYESNTELDHSWNRCLEASGFHGWQAAHIFFVNRANWMGIFVQSHQTDTIVHALLLFPAVNQPVSDLVHDVVLQTIVSSNYGVTDYDE